MSQSTDQLRRSWARRYWLRPHLSEARSASWPALVMQVVFIAGALTLYYAVRALSKGGEATARANAQQLLSLEETFGLDFELAAQRLVIERPGWVAFFNWIYVWTYWPLLLGALLFLWVRHRREYTILRDALVFSGAVGLFVFAVYPVAPPRFLHGFTDTVTQSSREHFVAHPPGFINEFAALPSFHLGWQALAALMLARFLPRRLQALALVPPALMTAAIIVTANHYVVDAIAGIGLSLAGLALATRLHEPDRFALVEAPTATMLRRIACSGATPPQPTHQKLR